MTAGESKVTTEGVRFEKQTRRKTVRKTVRQFHPVAARQREDRGLAKLGCQIRREDWCWRPAALWWRFSVPRDVPPKSAPCSRCAPEPIYPQSPSLLRGVGGAG